GPRLATVGGWPMVGRLAVSVVLGLTGNCDGPPAKEEVMGFEHILVERSGEFATITMNRTQRRNALSLEHMRELITAFRDLGGSHVLGIVLAGSGPVFSAGHDF